MGVKKIARPINKAKNTFVQWLKDNNARNIYEYEGGDSEDWDYYTHVNAFINDSMYVVYFEMWRGNIKISYRDEENDYHDMCIDEFLQLIS